MDIAANAASVTVVRSTWKPVRREALWPSLASVWTRHLDRRVEQDVHRLDHPGVLADMQEALHG